MNWNLIDRSLCQFNGISVKEERSLHRQGVRDWRMLKRYYSLQGMSWALERLLPQIRVFEKARSLEMIDVLVNMLPIGQRTRIIADRYERTLFFDIETSGISPVSRISMMSASMNNIEYTFVRGKNLEAFLDLWHQAEVIVTFNGKRFDVPRVMREFKLSTVPAHVDLMDEGRVYGFTGGLKTVERKIGFVREELSCNNGLAAIEEWESYVQRKDFSALNRLMRYNMEDVRSLKFFYSVILKQAVEGIFGL